VTSGWWRLWVWVLGVTGIEVLGLSELLLTAVRVSGVMFAAVVAGTRSECHGVSGRRRCRGPP
jgi:hypothetical protein